MNYKNPKFIWGVIFALLSLLLICFIFLNSVQPREESAEASSRVMEFLRPLFDPRNRISDEVFHHYVRKAAHFAEFAALGFSLMGLSDCLPLRKRGLRLPMPALASLLVAAADETIQLFSPERGPGVQDVLLDFCGGVFGVACMAVLLLLIRRAGKKK